MLLRKIRRKVMPWYRSVNWNNLYLFTLKMLIIIVALLLLTVKVIYGELPDYAIKMCEGFKIDTNVFERWSFAESTHCKYATEGGYYGRFNIGKEWLQDYMRYTKQPFENIKNIKEFLEDDYNNCYITAWSYAFWRRQGYTARQIVQIWLFGLKNIKKGRWSKKYEKMIFGSIK